METSFLVIFLFMLLQKFGSSISTTTSSNVTCIEGERQSLLAFKHKITDRVNRLSTWSGVECCEWHGVGCDTRTGHVVKLDLRTPGSYEMIVDSDICLEVSKSCKGNNPSYKHVDKAEAHDDDDLWFYSGMGPGFIMGFLGLLGSLHFIRRWRCLEMFMIGYHY